MGVGVLNEPLADILEEDEEQEPIDREELLAATKVGQAEELTRYPTMMTGASLIAITGGAIGARTTQVCQCSTSAQDC